MKTYKLLLILLALYIAQPLMAQNDSAYWNNRFLQLLRWTYVDTSLSNLYLAPDSTNQHVNVSTYQRIAWYGYTFQPSDQWPVVFNVAIGDGDPQTLTLPALEQLAQWGAFHTNEDYRRLVDDELRAMAEEMAEASNDTSYIIHHTAFIDSMEAVLMADSIAFADEQQRQALERTKQRMKRDQIFILNIRSARSQYMFGLEINLYNCFDKTVSMLEFNVAPYNDKGRLQEDKFHRSVRTMRCMGPIHPDHPAQYTFDELFWDDKSRIKYMRINSITFYFTDGTSKSYNGYQNVMKHTLR